MQQDSPAIWLKRIREGQEVLQRWVSRSDPYVRAHNGKFPNSLSGNGAESVDSNFVLAVTRTYISQLFFRNPKITIPHRAPDDLEHAHIASSVMNRVIQEAKVEESFQSAMADAILRGGGWLKLGYHTESAPIYDEEVVVNSAAEDVHRENEKLLQGLDVEAHEDENHIKHVEGHQALLDNPEILVGLIQQFGDGAALKFIAHIEDHKRRHKAQSKKGRLDWRVEPENVWARHVDPRDVIIDPNATTWEDARWVAFRVVRTLASVKRDPAYKNTSALTGSSVTTHQDLSGGRREGQTELDFIQQQVLASNKGRTALGQNRKNDSTFADLADPDDIRVEMFEVWDRQTERLFVVTDQSKRFLRNSPSPYLNLPGFFPLVHLTFATKHGNGGEMEQERPYGYSLVEPWWGQQLELNKFESLRLCIAKSNVPKYVADASISDAALKKLSRGDVGVVVKLSNQTPEGIAKDPRLAVAAVNLQSTSIDIHQAIANIKDAISFASGLGEIQLGGASSARTATAAQVQVASQSASLDKMLDRIENAFQHLAKIVRGLVRQFYTTERAIAITGPEGQAWTTYLGSDLYGDEILVETRTSAAANDNLKKFEALQLYNLLAQNPAVKIRELTDYTLREHGVPTPANFLKTDEEIQAEIAAQQQAASTPGQPGGPVDTSIAQQSAPSEGQIARNATTDKLQNGLPVA